MPMLAISRSEPIAMKVVSKTHGANGCQHFVGVVELDGQQFNINGHEVDLDAAPTTAELHAFVVTWLKLRKQRGKLQTGARIV